MQAEYLPYTTLYTLQAQFACELLCVTRILILHIVSSFCAYNGSSCGCTHQDVMPAAASEVVLSTPVPGIYKQGVNASCMFATEALPLLAHSSSGARRLR